ncbi:MAG: NADH-quinone oxidoreductase subunit NuoF [Synergistetes bacterium]|nr:NADH-quinone oxidoreductase subunit NuoF [Synergistota bacterium]MCX8128157.1 NADH-quinone oxidoreductase subunit NuoF [Synergistota bacterium]MDW8192533.1 NADH-quinone oxidoreductase subunit NuoF [Synergistota bacterium]
MRIERAHVLVGIDAGAVLAGAREVQRKLEEEIKKRGLEDEVRVLETGSLGITGRGVVLLVYPEGVYYVNVKLEDVPQIVEEHLLKGRFVKRLMLEPQIAEILARGEAPKKLARQKRVVLQNAGVINPDSIEEYIATGGYEALAKALESSPEWVINEIENSGLRGRGGAGFPTGRKWRITADVKASQKFVVCNADEGEPGTFKDRLILEGDPHKVLEGMIIAGYAVGAKRGYLYIRGEYELSIRRIGKAIEDAYKMGLLGDNILETGFSFHVEIKKGAGAYVCGEETALIESIEGKRGNPRPKPPYYPGVKGLWGYPTVVNNVETLANVPPIILNGASWFRSIGTRESPGTKVYTILGHVNEPGLIEVEMGTTLKEVIFDFAKGIRNNRQFKAALIGGAAGAFLGRDALDIPLSYEGLKEYGGVLGSGAILVFDEATSIVDMLKNVIFFFKHESCGKCVPCRVGISKLYEKMERIAVSKGSEKDFKEMMEISDKMADTALCALGQSVILPLSSAVKFFKSELIS